MPKLEPPQPPPPPAEEEWPSLPDPCAIPPGEVLAIYLEFRRNADGEGELADWLRRAKIQLGKWHVGIPEPGAS